MRERVELVVCLGVCVIVTAAGGSGAVVPFHHPHHGIGMRMAFFPPRVWLLGVVDRGTAGRGSVETPLMVGGLVVTIGRRQIRRRVLLRMMRHLLLVLLLLLLLVL